MKTKHLFFYLAIIISLQASTFATAQAVNTTDSLALIDLYNSTNGRGWTMRTNWLGGPVKTWYGVVVAGTRVKQIVLRNNELNGALPASVGNLSELDTLDLGYNYNLSGPIPPTIGNLINLAYLNLETCKLNGRVPIVIGNLKKLLYLNLLNNRLTGIIPASIGKLTKIKYINIAVNQLSDTLPAVIGDLTGLTDLYLSDNGLTGAIPPSLGKLTNLLNLVLRNNKLSGVLPATLGSLINLRYSYFDRNNLTGGIPTSITDLKNLIILDLSENRLAFNHNIDTTIQLGNSRVFMNIGYNHFTFDGNELFGQKNKYPNIIYTPQAQISIHKQATTLAVSAGGTLSNNTYKWFKIGSAAVSTIRGDSTFHPAVSGRYYATVTNRIATDLTLYTDTTNYTAPLGATKTSITIYPNPVHDVLTLNGLDAGTANAIVIADAGGHVWLSAAVEQQATATLNVSRLKPGYYVVNVSSGSSTGSVRFIKE